MEQEKPKKKRGRKPKKVVEQVENKNPLANNMVIKLNHINEENNVILPFNDENFCVNENNNCGSICWNCCHPFQEIVYGLPLKYISGIFYTYGDFCSLECAARYALEYFDNYHEIISLVNLYFVSRSLSFTRIIISASSGCNPSRILINMVSRRILFNASLPPLRK